MSLTITESGLTFGPFETSNLFHIEKSESYKECQAEVKIAEFLWVQNTEPHQLRTLWVVEAKSSIPKPSSKEYECFFDDIKTKLANSLAFTVSGYLNRNPKTRNELPALFTQLDWSNTDIKLTLIIPGLPDEHLPAINDKFRKKLISLRNIWAIEELSILVLNTKRAIKFGLST